MHSQSYSGLVSMTGSLPNVHGLAILAMYRLELPSIAGSFWAHTRYCTPSITSVVASSAKESIGVTI